MRSLKTMLIAGAAAGMMLGGASAASAQGQPIPEGDVRESAHAMMVEYMREECGDIRRPRSVEPVPTA